MAKIKEIDFWLEWGFAFILILWPGDSAKGAFTESDIEKVKCGHIDNCTSAANYTAGGIGIERYSEYPFYCRCDPKSCAEYSECCPSARNDDLKLVKPLMKYSCKHVPEMDNIWTGILMVDDCPEGIDADLNIRCLNSAEDEDYRYTLDLPVHSTVTRRTYRNIYCGLCNGEKPQDFAKIQTYVVCKNKTSELNTTDFLRGAVQKSPRKFVSTTGEGECQLRVLQLTPKSLYAQSGLAAENNGSSFFELHFCRIDQITECPESYANRRVSELCSSYKQPVLGADRKAYKNPHCYLCNVPEGSQARTPRCDRTIDFSSGSVSPIQRTGLNLVFDFSFSSTSAVGSRDICASNEIWDYIHETCQAIQCPADFKLINHACVGISGENISNLTSSNRTASCNWIVVQQHINISETNDSISIQLESETHKFGPNEYKRLNESTISVCISSKKSTESSFSSLVSYVSDICLGISIVLSFIHLLLFACLRALRTFAKKILACITFSIFMSQLLFLTMLQYPSGTWVCAAVGVVLHYFFLASFTWMTTMAFDIHRKFSGSMLSGRHQTRSGIRRTFFKYSLFAWLAPLVFIGFGISIDYLPSVAYPDEVHVLNVLNKRWTVNSDANSSSLGGLEDFQPAYGQGLCWFNNRLALLVFFGAPVAVLVGLNCLFFGLAAWSILSQNSKAKKVLKKAEAQTEGADGSKPKQASWEKHNQVNVRMYGKLALIMGVTWVLGFVANLAKQNWIWLAFVVLNGLQGTLIFCGFDLRWKTWQLCKRRFAKSWCGKLFPSFGVEESSSRNLSSKDRTFSTRTSSSTLPSRTVKASRF